MSRLNELMNQGLDLDDVKDAMNAKKWDLTYKDIGNEGNFYRAGEDLELIILPKVYFPERFARLGVETTTRQLEDCLQNMKGRCKKISERIYEEVIENIVKYTDQELLALSSKKWDDWCNDIGLFVVLSWYLFGKHIECKLKTDCHKVTQQKAEKLRLELEQQAEQMRLQLEQEALEKEMEKQRIAEIAKAEKKRKREESEKKAKEASKRNLPPYPPHQKQKSKQDSQMVSNTKAQKEWLKKYVPDWDGLVWSKKQASDYINDIKKGTDVIVCSVVPVAEGYVANDEDCVDLVVAEASLPDFVNL